VIHNESGLFFVLCAHMSVQVALIFAAIVVSWVMFVFNFVLGYYMGRAVEAAEQVTKKKKLQENKTNKKHFLSSFQAANYAN